MTDLLSHYPTHSIAPQEAKINTFDDDDNNDSPCPIDFKSIPYWDRLKGGYWGINEATQDLYYRGWKSNHPQYNK